MKISNKLIASVFIFAGALLAFYLDGILDG